MIDPHFVIGHTEPLGTKLTDVETDGTRTIISVAAQFNADMIGKVAVLTKLDGTDSVTTTVTSYFDTDSIELNDAPAWTEEGSILIIEDSQPRGLLFDLVGLSLNSGEWHEKLRDAGGEAVARRLILGAELVAGADAVRLGLAQWSAPAAELEARAQALTARLAELPPQTLAANKHCIEVAARGGEDGFEAELAASAQLLAAPETQRRVRAFLEGK